MEPQSVLALILAVIAAVPQLTETLTALINDLKQAFGSEDQALIDAALAHADTLADAQHRAAQGG